MQPIPHLSLPPCSLAFLLNPSCPCFVILLVLVLVAHPPARAALDARTRPCAGEAASSPLVSVVLGTRRHAVHLVAGPFAVPGGVQARATLLFFQQTLAIASFALFLMLVHYWSGGSRSSGWS